MQINISARHGHLSDATQAKLTARLDRMSRLFERLTAIELTVDLAHKLEHKEVLRVDLKVSAEHKHDFVATDTGEELMACLDSAVHKIEQQLRKYKERVQDHRGPGLRQQSAPVEPEAEASHE